MNTAQRRAVAALTLFAVVDVLGAIMAVGRFEWRITVSTHGYPDILAADAVYEVFDHVVGVEFFPVLWVLALAAVIAGVLPFRATVWRDPWIAVAALLTAASLLPMEHRLIAYPLWTAAAVSVVIAACRAGRRVAE